MALNLQQFEQIILQILSPDNNLRTQAEAAFNETKKQPDFCVLSLLELSRRSQHEQVRALSIVLLRRVLTKIDQSLWTQVNPQTQQTVKVQLLEALESENANHIRHKVEDCISEVAIVILEAKGAWDEILPFLFKLTKSAKEGHRESALNIFNQLASEMGETLRTHFNLLNEVLNSGLNDPSIKVRIAAMNATATFLQVLDRPEERTFFQQLTPLMLNTISSALNGKQEEDARTALQLFVDLAEMDATFLKPNLQQIITAMLQISTASVLEDATRQLGVEFFVTLAESKPGMVRKIPKFLETLLPIVLNMMISLEDNPSWHEGDEEDDVEITDSDVGEESLDRLALSLGGKMLVPILFSAFPQLLGDQDWKKRHTALMALAIIGEGCRKYMENNLGDILKNVLPFVQDPHPRVRWAACNAIGQMSTDFGPEFQMTLHAQAVPALITLMGDKDHPRVQSHAAASIINFCENCSLDILTPYLDAMVASLLRLLQEGRTLVQEQAVTAIAAIADCIEENFIKYYDSVIPFLKSILTNANNKEHRKLRGKAMECISLIGIAVGKEKFFQDAKEVMELLLKTQTAQLESDDPQVSFLLQAWARICKCLGQDFVPYLNIVMPPLLASARIPPDIRVTDAGNEASLPEGWELIPVGDKRIGINTSALEEKATACNMLYCYAAELKEGFFPYVDEVTKLLVPLMKFYYNDGVRQAAVTTMPHLLTSSYLYLQKSGAAKGADVAYARNLFNFMFPDMVASVKEEMDQEILLDGIEAFISCLRLIGENALTLEQLTKVVEACLHWFQDVQDRNGERIARKREEDHDDEEEEKMEAEEEIDQSIMLQIAEIIGQLSKLYQDTFPPLFQQYLMPLVVEMMKPTSPPGDRQSALFIFDDLVDYLKAKSLPFFQHFFPLAIQYVVDPEPAVRQAAVYGMGSCMEVGGEQVKSVALDVLSRLTQSITSPDAKERPFLIATDNAIAAVGKILKFQSGSIDAQSAFPLWLSWLPVTNDKIEAKVTYNLLCDFIESNNPYIFGNNFANLPKIIAVIASALGTEFVDEAITRRFVNIVKQMNASMQDACVKIFPTLTPDQQQKVKQCLA